MATSGSFNTSKVGNFYFTFAWTRTGYSSSANEHYIYYEVVAHNTAGNFRTVYTKDLWINGSQAFYKSGANGANGVSYYDGYVVTSGNITVASSNSAGDGNLAASFAGGVGTWPSTNCSGEGSWALDRIPRYATSVQSLKSKTETSITMNWSSDSTIDYIWYSKDNGSNWTGINVTDGKSGSYTISELSAYTTYNIKTRVRRKDSQLTTDSSSTSVTTYDYPYCTSSPNFIIGEAVTLSFYNPLGRSFTFYIIANGTQIENFWTISGTSYTGINSYSTSVPQLYATIPNASSGRYQVKVVYGSSTKTRNNGNTFSMKSSDCVPTFAKFEYRDVGERSTTLTGNDQIIINNYNVVEVVISPENKAVGAYGASIKKYRAVCGNVVDEKDYSSDSDVVLRLSYIKDRTITVHAIDSRENSIPVSIAIANDNWRDYSDILIQSGSIERADGVGTTATLKFQGTIWNYTFGAKENEITKCQYRYKKSNKSEYEAPIDITPTRQEDLFSFNATIKGDLEADGFNVSNSFNIQIIIEDEIRTATYDVLLGAGTPAMAIHPDGVSVGAPYDESQGGPIQISGKSILNLMYPVGSIYMSVNNTNPNSLFGGTWVAWGAGKVPVGIDTSDTNFSTVEKTGGAKTHTHTQGATGASSGSTGGPSNNTSGSTALTVAQMPSHRHVVSNRSTISTGSTTTWRSIVSADSANADYSYTNYTDYQGSGSGHTHTLSSHTHSLNSHTHTNPTTASSSSLQPYITCYMWKRTA